MAFDVHDRSALGRVFAALAIGVIVLAGTGLLAIQYHQRRAADAMARVLEAGSLLELARSAQVNFTLQVQEWNNLLLRSRTAADLERQAGTFAAQEQTVDRHLAQLVARGLPDDRRREVEAIRAEHRRLGELYRAALTAYVPGDGQTILAVDNQVRGIDRGLDQRIDALAASIFRGLRSEAEALRAQGEREYDLLRMVISGVAAGVILLSGVLAWLAMRTAEQPRLRSA